jgi:hypothetical protein
MTLEQSFENDPQARAEFEAHVAESLRDRDEEWDDWDPSGDHGDYSYGEWS